MGIAKSKEKSEGIDGINTLTSQSWHFLWFSIFMVQTVSWETCLKKKIQQQLGPQIYACLEIPCQGGR